MGKMMYLKGVVTLELEQEKCVGCGVCLTVCPRQVFVMNNGCAAIANKDLCIECGACSGNCPAEALHVKVGVGCAAAVINSALGRTSSSCCCVIEPDEDAEKGRTKRKTRSACC